MPTFRSISENNNKWLFFYSEEEKQGVIRVKFKITNSSLMRHFGSFDLPSLGYQGNELAD